MRSLLTCSGVSWHCWMLTADCWLLLYFVVWHHSSAHRAPPIVATLMCVSGVPVFLPHAGPEWNGGNMADNISKMYLVDRKCQNFKQWNTFLRVWSKTSHLCFRKWLGTIHVPSHCLKLWWPGKSYDYFHPLPGLNGAIRYSMQHSA